MNCYYKYPTCFINILYNIQSHFYRNTLLGRFSINIIFD